jgi:protein-tyrosine phosphatase
MRRIAGFSLWLGHVGDVRDLRAVLSADILALVDLAVNEAPAHVTRELVYCRFPLVDGQGNPLWLLRAAVDCVAGLLHSDTPTLVFCSNGMNRSPCIAAAAVARVKGCPVAEALALIVASGAADISPGLWSEVQGALI